VLLFEPNGPKIHYLETVFPSAVLLNFCLVNQDEFRGLAFSVIEAITRSSFVLCRECFRFGLKNVLIHGLADAFFAKREVCKIVMNLLFFGDEESLSLLLNEDIFVPVFQVVPELSNGEIIFFVRDVKEVLRRFSNHEIFEEMKNAFVKSGFGEMIEELEKLEDREIRDHIEDVCKIISE
jgi:hypothetical protein